MTDVFLGAELGADVPEVDLHGMTQVEAKDALERLIQGAFMHSERIIRVVHGQGTGTLKEMVRGVFEHHPNITTYRIDTSASYAEIERK